MTASILPFRFARRVGQVRKTADYMATLDHNYAESHLREVLRRMGDSLRRRGVAEPLIQAELAAYEGAIRARLWHVLLDVGGAA